MTCSQVQSLLEDYLDRELPDATSLTVAAHLESCPKCRAELEISRHLGRLLRGGECPEPPAEYWHEVRGLILARTVDHVPGIVAEDRDRRRRERTSLHQSLLAVAASLVIFFGALLAGSNQETSPALFTRAEAGPLTKAELVAMACADPNSEACAEEQARLAKGLLLMGRTGLLGGSTDLVASLGIK